MADPVSPAAAPHTDAPREAADPFWRRPRTRRTLRYTRRLTVELFVVFVGVYAAFLLNRYQEGQRDAGRRAAIYEALLTDVERTAGQIEEHRAILRDTWIEPVAEPYERGEQPALRALWLPTPPLSHVWDSVLDSGVDLVDPALIGQVEAQRAAVQFMLDQANVTIDRSNTHITPALGAADFYGPDGRLRPQYAWYAYFLRYLEGNAGWAATMTDSLRQELVQRIDAPGR